MNTGQAALPLDFVVVCSAADGATLDMAQFAGGEMIAGARPGAQVVFHTGVAEEMLQSWRATGTPCVRIERALSLVAPGMAAATSARAWGDCWVGAVRRLRPNSEVLRRAAALLDDDDAALRSLLHRGLAQLALARGRAAQPSWAARPEAEAGAPQPQFLDFGAPAHAALDAAFAHLRRQASAARPFEPRAAQLEMAHAVLDALLAGGNLVVEAGTGIGKTLAYALPAVILAVQRDDRIVFSTHTRNLQHQLVDRDLPWLWTALGLDHVPRHGGGRGLRFAKLLGRENYVCRTALAQAARAATTAHFELAQALLWSLATCSGELGDIAMFLDERTREALRSRVDLCGGRACRDAESCPVFVARDRARRADLVVINHALLFSDALADGGILGPASGLVIDEAHHLDAVATEHLSVRIGRAQADALVAPLGHIDARTPDVPPRVRGVGRDVAAARSAVLALLDAVAANLHPLRPAARTRQRYRDGDEVFAPVRHEVAAAQVALDHARDGVAELRADPGAVPDGAVPALDGLAAALAETRSGLEFVTRAGDEDWAFALDVDARSVHEIVALPLDVAPAVQRLLAKCKGAVYTSATLAAGEDLGDFVRRVGLAPTTPQRVLPSPFDWPAQCSVAVAQHLPAYDDPAHVAAAAALLAAVAGRTARRMLVLCTAHAMLRRLHAALWRTLGVRAPVMAQDVTASREVLAARFATTPGAILLGTASFWEGVDFPGDALEILVIGKLPFRPPDDPLVEARCERLRGRGDDPFGDYLLPDAVLRFRQGFGRLVRTQRDRGIVLILDARFSERNYGAAFRRALPVTPLTFHSDAALVAHVEQWFAGSTIVG
jgi:Rad3-related DNA helicase